ncbi:NAD(P)-binding domain-containing protein [Sorangium sp. So ce216]
MKFGFIGAGTVAQTLSKHLLAHGHEVVLSNSRGPDTLSDLIRNLGPGARAGTPTEAADQEFVILAVMWHLVPEALAAVPDWSGRALIDATNRFESYSPVRLGDLSGKTSSEIVADLAPGARVLKAFNSVPMDWIQNYSDSKPRTVLFISGDDELAKGNLRTVLEGIGFACVDLGSLAVGGRLQQVGGPLAGLNLVLQGRFPI